MAHCNIFSNEWCDLIFEDKNKNYGAYMLRKFSAKRHVLSLVIACIVFVLGVSFPSIIHSITPEWVEKDVSVRSLSNIKLDKPREDVNDIVKALPPPPQLIRNVIKFNTYVIKPDELVDEENEPKMQQEVIKSTSAIGSIDYKGGTDDPNALMPEVMPTDDQKIVEEEMEPKLLVEQMPEFPGGESEMYKYLKENTKFPQFAKDVDITGIVYVRFVVNKDGKITDITVLRGIGGGCDEEAVRVIKSMPPWKPGRQNGVPVPVYFNLPIKFTLL